MRRPRFTLSDCVFEERIAGGIALYDASHLMPRREERRKKRDPAKVELLFIHHSGKLGLPGVMGAWVSANYMVNQRKRKDGTLLKAPGPAYPFWAPHEDLVDQQGRLVVLRLNPDDERSYHTGRRANIIGDALCLQGNTSARPLSHSHEEILEGFIPWWVEKRKASMPECLSMHSESKPYGGSGKKACPGKGAEAWLKGYRRGYRTEAA